MSEADDEAVARVVADPGDAPAARRSATGPAGRGHVGAWLARFREGGGEPGTLHCTFRLPAEAAGCAARLPEAPILARRHEPGDAADASAEPGLPVSARAPRRGPCRRRPGGCGAAARDPGRRGGDRRRSPAARADTREEAARPLEFADLTRRRRRPRRPDREDRRVTSPALRALRLAFLAGLALAALSASSVVAWHFGWARQLGPPLLWHVYAPAAALRWAWWWWRDPAWRRRVPLGADRRRGGRGRAGRDRPAARAAGPAAGWISATPRPAWLAAGPARDRPGRDARRRHRARRRRPQAAAGRRRGPRPRGRAAALRQDRRHRHPDAPDLPRLRPRLRPEGRDGRRRRPVPRAASARSSCSTPPPATRPASTRSWRSGRATTSSRTARWRPRCSPGPAPPAATTRSGTTPPRTC